MRSFVRWLPAQGADRRWLACFIFILKLPLGIVVNAGLVPSWGRIFFPDQYGSLWTYTNGYQTILRTVLELRWWRRKCHPTSLYVAFNMLRPNTSHPSDSIRHGSTFNIFHLKHITPYVDQIVTQNDSVLNAKTHMGGNQWYGWFTT